MTHTTLLQIRQIAEEMHPGEYISLPHLLSAWARSDPQRELSELLSGSGVSAKDVERVASSLHCGRNEEDEKLLTACVIHVSQGAVTGRHLLQAIGRSQQHRLARALADAGLSWEKLLQKIEQERDKAGILAQCGLDLHPEKDLIEKYGRDLVECARQGSFDALCERPEIDILLEVLLRKQKGNAVLTGAAGVGKTALVELFARRLARGEVPQKLEKSRLFEMNMSKLVAGTKYRGDFEQRMDDVIAALEKFPSVILFIDEMHLMWSAGRAEGILTGASEILKPHLLRGAFRVLGATTSEEYNRHIAQDKALARRFQEIQLEEPGKDLLVRMIECQIVALEAHHGIGIPRQLVPYAIEITDRHLVNRFQPDKTLDLFDSSAVFAARENRKELGERDLLAVLARQTGRPISALTGEDRMSLMQLERRFHERIVGQEGAVRKVIATLVHRRQDLGAAERNLGTFLFAGDTGVGKTETARTIASVFFDNPKKLLVIDLAEYSQPGSVNKLIGSPAGYVDSEREGVLVRWLHENGSGVLLFDELEKAHPDARMLLLGLLDQGRIVSARGETMDVRQCVVVLTTNAITSKDMSKGSLGFRNRDSGLDPEEMLADYFPREFLGRMDEVILFDALEKSSMREIVLLRWKESVERLAGKGISVEYPVDPLVDLVLDALDQNRSGARGIVRVIERKILQPIALALLMREGGGTVHVELGDPFFERGEVTVRT